MEFILSMLAGGITPATIIIGFAFIYNLLKTTTNDLKTEITNALHSQDLRITKIEMTLDRLVKLQEDHNELKKETRDIIEQVNRHDRRIAKLEK